MTESQPAPSVKNRLVAGFVWTIGSRAIAAIFSFVGSILLARILMPEDFGLVALAVSLSTIVNSLASLPLSEALIQTSDVDEDHVRSTYTLGMARAVLLAVLLCLSAWPIAHFYHETRLFGMMLALALITLLSGLFSPRWALIQKQLSFVPAAVQNVALRVVYVVVSLVIAYLYKSVWAIICAMIAAQVVSVIITHCYAPSPFRFGTKRIKDIWSFSVWASFSGIVNTINTKVDALMVGSMLGARDLGYYWYADDKANIPTREVSAPLVTVLLPGLARVKDDPARLEAGYRRVQSLIFAICVPAGIGFALIADQFVHVLLGDKWRPIIPIIQILAPVLALEALIACAKPLALACGRTRELFHRDITNFVVRTPVVLLSLYFYGLPGILIARAITIIYGILLFMLMVRKISGISMVDQFRDCTRSFGALAIMVIGVLLFKDGAMAIHMPGAAMMLGSILTGGLCYAGGHLLLWQMSGCPDGPEREALDIIGSLLRKAGRSAATPSGQGVAED